MLIQAMEDEGFEVERLMLTYLENEPWWENLRKEGLDRESLRQISIEHPESQLPELAELLFSFMVGPSLEVEVALQIANAFQAEVWRTFPEMHDLHQKELAEFIEKVAKMAEVYLTDEAADYDDFLETGERAIPQPYQEEFNQSLAGIQQYILEFRERHDKKPNNPSHIKVEIIEVCYRWLTEPDNTVKLWYKASCAEGVFYNFVPFRHLVEQAALHYPDWYYKIEALRDGIVALRPKEKEIVEALLAESFDLVPLLESYVNEWVDAQACLKFEGEIKDRQLYENRYDLDVKNRGPWGSGLEHVREVTLLADRLEDLAYDIICSVFPDMIKAAKPWMIKSLRQSAHLLVCEAMDKVWGLLKLCEQKTTA